MSRGAERFASIDAIKAAGIVTIVLIHALPPPWDTSATPLERWLQQVTRFGVPGFLLASGFLYATAPADLATTLRRLRRILVPYLIASGLAQLWHLAWGTDSPGSNVWIDLLLAASFGPYYYVFVITWLVALTPAIARLPHLALAAATAALIAAQWAVDPAEAWPLGFHFHLRNPLLWWAYFFTGWLLRLHDARLEAWLAPRRSLLVAGLAGAVAALTFSASELAGLPRLVARTAAWLDVYAILALIGVAAGGRPSTSEVRALSDATYSIYLYHLFFLLGVQQLLPPSTHRALAVLLPFAAGLYGALGLVALGRRLLGPRARDWLGA